MHPRQANQAPREKITHDVPPLVLEALNPMICQGFLAHTLGSIDYSKDVTLNFTIIFNNKIDQFSEVNTQTLNVILSILSVRLANEKLHLNIDFQGIPIKNNFKDFFAAVATSTNLLSLSINGCEIEEAEKNNLINSLKNNRSIVELRFNENDIDDTFVTTLCAEVLENHPTLSKLAINDDVNLSDASLFAIARVLRSNTNLAFLTLDRLDAMTPAGVIEIFKTLPTNFTLQHLSILPLELNLTDPERQFITNCIKANLSLRQLQLPYEIVENDESSSIEQHLVLNNELLQKYFPDLDINFKVLRSTTSETHTLDCANSLKKSVEILLLQAASLCLQDRYLGKQYHTASYPLLAHALAAVLKSKPTSQMVDGGVFELMNKATNFINHKVTCQRYSLSLFDHNTVVPAVESVTEENLERENKRQRLA